MNNGTSASRYYAVAGNHRNSTYTLVVLRRSDGHEVWGDEPLAAQRWADIPAAATARLAAGTAYRLTSDWREEQAPADGPIYGPSWQADAEGR